MKTAKICALIAFIANLLSLFFLWPLLRLLFSTRVLTESISPAVAPTLEGIVVVVSFVLWMYFAKKEKENQVVKYAKLIGYALIALAPILLYASYVVADPFLHNLLFP